MIFLLLIPCAYHSTQHIVGTTTISININIYYIISVSICSINESMNKWILAAKNQHYEAMASSITVQPMPHCDRELS